jgi:DNA-binding transcriptional LysR family regulator
VDAAVPLSGGSADEIITRRLGRVGFGLYAAPEYIERRGGLRGTADAPLAGHDVIAPTSLAAGSPSTRWITEHGKGATVAVRCDDQQTIMAAARAGLGVAVINRPRADADPGLQRLDQGDGLFFRQLWVLVHRDLQHVARIVAMRAFLTQVFAALDPACA